MTRFTPLSLFVLLTASAFLSSCGGDKRTFDDTPRDDDWRPSTEKPEVTVPRLARSVTCGGQTACAVFSDGTVWCWGAGTSFGVGDGKTAYPWETPVQVLIDHVDKLYFSGLHFCALHFSGGVSCWGSNGWEQLGNEKIVLGSTVPVHVADVADVVDLFVPGTSTAALLADGHLIGWGTFSAGNPMDPDVVSPRPMRLASGVETALVTGLGCCIVDVDGVVWCQGKNYYGQLGLQNPVALPHFARVQGLEPVGGLVPNCAWLKDGRVQCWGADLPIAVDGSHDALVEPVFMPGFTDVTRLLRSSSQICGMDSVGEVSCVGTRPGTGNVVDEVATPVEGLGSVQSFCLGRSFACAVREDGPVVCWGNSADGELGQKKSSTTPVVVHFPFEHDGSGTP